MQGARVLSQLASVTVLARLLPPEAYGLMAMAMVVANLAYLFRDMGTAAALIQAQDISEAMVNTVHWTNVGLGLVIGVLIAGFAPLVSSAFRQPDLIPLLYVLALVFPISSIGVTRQALLERESKFSRVAKVEVSATTAGLLSAILLALLGAGVFSLAMQILVPAIVSTIMLYAVSSYKPLMRWRRRELLSILGFSGNLSLFNCVNYVSRNADSMVIGRLLGAAALGTYSLAYRLMLFPVQNMTSVATRALYPVMSRNQTSIEEMARLYLKSVGFIVFLTAPLMAGMFVLREPLVQLLFGEKWHAVPNVLVWLAPAGFIQSVVSTTGAIFMARGRTDLLLRLGVLGAIVQVSAFLLGSRWGVEGVAECYLAANILNAVPVLYFTGRLIGIDLHTLFGAVGRPVALALVMCAAVAIMDVFLKEANWPLILSFGLSVLLGVFIYGIGSHFLNPSQLRNLRSFLGR